MINTNRNDLEKYFEWYLSELKEAGFVKKYEREPFSFEVLPVQNYKKWNTKIKTPKIEDCKLFNNITYRFDYLVVWDPRAYLYFFNMPEEPSLIYCPFKAQIDSNNEYVSFVDVKPVASAAAYAGNSYAIFPIVQKLLWYYHKIFISKAIPFPISSKQKGTQEKKLSGNTMALFTTTFMPKRYLMTDGGKQARTINYRHCSLKEYVHKREVQLRDLIHLKSNNTLF